MSILPLQSSSVDHPLGGLLDFFRRANEEAGNATRTVCQFRELFGRKRCVEQPVIIGRTNKAPAPAPNTAPNLDPLEKRIASVEEQQRKPITSPSAPAPAGFGTMAVILAVVAVVAVLVLMRRT